MSEPTPEEYMASLSLLDNKQNKGQNPTIRPTADAALRDLPTIGTRGQERGEG